MKHVHKHSAAGRWASLDFLEQMAHIGSEVERALSWKSKHNSLGCAKAVDRALDLIDLTVSSNKKTSRFKELARLREAIADFFIGRNDYQFSDLMWRQYFYPFAYAIRKNY